MQNSELEIQANEITNNILDFYSLQPEVKKEKLEKLEIFIILISSYYINTIHEIENLQNNESENIFEELLKTLNDYLNKLSEEFEKIFPENKNPFQKISLSDKKIYNCSTFIEILKIWNNQEKNTFGIKNTLNEFKNTITKEDFEIEILWILIQNVINSIQLKMMIKIEDLL